MWAFAVVFAVAFTLGLLLTPWSGRLGQRLGVVAAPGGRRQHAGRISRLGGIGLYLPFVAAVASLELLPAAWVPASLDPKEGTRLLGLLLGSTLAFVVGLLDDRWEFPPLPQHALQVACSFIAIATLIFIERVMNPFTNTLLVFPWPVVGALTVFWVMGMMNTVNFLDGLDGLAGGVAAIICAILTLHMVREGQLSVALLPLALLGATLAFLPYNFHPARVFMGSSGAYFLGFALAALGIMAGARMATMLLMLLVPILDVAWVMAERWRAGGRTGQADRRHLHYRLLDLGLSTRQVVSLYYALCGSFGLVALLVSSRLFKLGALAVLGLGALALLWWVSRRGGDGSAAEE
ncbi:MAG: undecaprenyl/decaprenyl-phosphate alpha-N-acetylglucosaminyl 1-phosphate transferase [Chloroflexi bacterium]|nr:undecaprenyl/decaprenyl-phosphate alpha-N-acetylglucosaminyl 1-phosphate transferase [Chloroflexota bacterium]